MVYFALIRIISFYSVQLLGGSWELFTAWIQRKVTELMTKLHCEQLLALHRV